MDDIRDRMHTTLCHELNHAGLLCGGECVREQAEMDELHAEALKINPRGEVFEIYGGPEGLRFRVVGL